MNHHQPSSRPDTAAYEVPGLLGAVTKGFRETRRSRALVAVSLAVLSLGLIAPTAKARRGMDLPSESTGASGYITLDNPPIGGASHSNLKQGGWTL
jgi:hypothetical protein